MALNAPIQGSAADVVKVAMLRVDRAMRADGLRSRMLLQVRDELVFEVAGEAEALELSCGPRDVAAADLTVPLELSRGHRPQLARGRALRVTQDPARPCSRRAAP